ncbi:MAG TPA: hypothetical protein VHO69_11385 [Phototrophicaceae bacterium]|nr:hypothetical protein [Phototrophicaceae bacterium]
MSETFDKLKAQLETQGKLSEEDITKAIEATGPMTPEERAKVDAENYEKSREKERKYTMDEYLAASKILDTAAEGSDEYNKALKIVEAYESGG